MTWEMGKNDRILVLLTGLIYEREKGVRDGKRQARHAPRMVSALEGVSLSGFQNRFAQRCRNSDGQEEALRKKVVFS